MEYLLLIAIICGFLGAIVGSKKGATGAGALLGALLGPLGIFVAFTMDGRTKCRKCHGRLDGKPEVCPHCGAELAWDERPMPNVFAEVVMSAGEKAICFACPRCLARRIYPLASAGRLVNCLSCSGPIVLPVLEPPPKPPAITNLQSCPDCGKQISKRAAACPNCGCPSA